MTTQDVMALNPTFTYAQFVGYVGGYAAAEIGDQFAGLSETEWIFTTNEYAWGYRAGWNDFPREPRAVIYASVTHPQHALDYRRVCASLHIDQGHSITSRGDTL